MEDLEGQPIASDLFAQSILKTSVDPRKRSRLIKSSICVNRVLDDTPPEERDEKDKFIKNHSTQTLKDLDLENMIYGQLLNIDVSEADRELILTTLERDCH